MILINKCSLKSTMIKINSNQYSKEVLQHKILSLKGLTFRSLWLQLRIDLWFNIIFQIRIKRILLKITN